MSPVSKDMCNCICRHLLGQFPGQMNPTLPGFQHQLLKMRRYSSSSDKCYCWQKKKYCGQISATAAPAWGVSQLFIQLTMKYEVEDACCLMVTGQVDPEQQEQDALSSALLACLMDLLVERQEALWCAVRRVKQRYPGRLRGEVMARLGLNTDDEGSGSARHEMVLAALEFQDLYLLCELLAPAVAQIVDVEMSQQLSGMGAPSVLQLPASQQDNFARQLMMRREWDQWKKAMRTGLLLWFRQQQAQDGLGAAQALAGTPALTASRMGSSKALSARSRRCPDLLTFTFAFPKVNADGLRLTERARVRLEGPGTGQFRDKVERVLLSAFSGESEGLFSSMWLFNQGDGPLGCLGLPEEQIQQRLMKVAFETVRLPVAQEFHLSFSSSASISKSRLETSDHPKRNGQQVQGMSAAPSDTQQQVQAGTDFNAAAETRGDCRSAVADMVTFSGTATELRHIVYVLAALEEGAFHSSSGSSAAWYPSDGRIQLQRCRRRGELVYRLRVANSALPHEHKQQQNLLDIELSRNVIMMFIDCLDEFRSTHPDFAVLRAPMLP